MAEPLSLVVLAAGLGSRYGGLKQVEPVGPGGESIMDYSVFDALRAGFSRVVFVVSRAVEEPLRERAARTVARRCETVFAVQDLDDLPPGVRCPPGRTKPWGTGHAVLAAGRAVRGPFAVINADDWYGPSSFAALAASLRAPRSAPPVHFLVGYRLDRTLSEHGAVSRAVCEVDPDGWLRSAREVTHIVSTADGPRAGDTVLSPEDIVSMNMWGFDPAIFDSLAEGFARFLRDLGDGASTREFYLPALVDELVRAGAARVRVLPTAERWYGMTYPADREPVRAALRRETEAGRYPTALWAPS